MTVDTKENSLNLFNFIKYTKNYVKLVILYSVVELVTHHVNKIN